jgi:membrane protein required for colicin V production
MNWLDIVILVLVGLSIISSMSNGFSREVVGLIATIAGLFLGIWFYGPAGSFLLPYVSTRAVANFCGFILVFVGVMILGAMVGYSIGKLIKVAGLSWFDRLLGAGFGAVKGLLLSIALITALLAFAPGHPGDAPPKSVVESRSAPYIIEAARGLSTAAPNELKEGFRRRYDEVKAIWRRALGSSHGRGTEGV